MVSFENLLGAVRAYNPRTDADLLRRAYEFSAHGHAGQTRRSGEQYITHPLEVARFAAEMHLDDVTIAASLLHDVVEDTLTTIENVRALFGPEIANVVEGVTKISTIPFSSQEERQAENFRKMLVAMASDWRVILVKLADRLHNMRTLGHLGEERRLGIAQETVDIYAPIAHRLGMNKVKNELEELSFRHLDPAAYESLRKLVEERRRATEGTVERLKRTLARKLWDAGVPIVALEGRIKSIFSIWRKIRRQRISLDEVYDLIAVRVITTSVGDCYGALGIVHATWPPVHGRFKDFVAMPRPNGYRSLHTAVISDLGLPFEVQLRTEEMHQVAEEGIAAHWKYKEGRVADAPDENYFQWLRAFLASQQGRGDPREFISDLKRDLYAEEVYAFTPKGEVKALPKDATPVDFAYAVHTDVGHSCVGVRVNGRMVPLRTPLRSGDIVEVVTRAGNRPNRDWQKIAVTTRAINKIKQFVNAEEKRHAVDLGRKLLEKGIRRFALTPRTVLKPEKVVEAGRNFGAAKPDDVYASVGYGKVSARVVLDALVPREQRLRRKPTQAIAATVRRVLRRSSPQETIEVRGFDDFMVSRAGCCNPIRGEAIVGYVTRGKGVSVHAASCSNVTKHIYDPERRIDVAWGKTPARDAAFTVSLSIRVHDRTRMMADVTSCLADRKINIRKVDGQGDDADKGRPGGHISVTFDIGDIRQLQGVIRGVQGVAGVLEVERVQRRP